MCRNSTTVDQAQAALEHVAIVGEGIAGMEPSYLHWMIADGTRSIVVEYMADGMHIHDDKANVLATQLAFDWHLENLRSYYMVDPCVPEARQWRTADLAAYGTGAGMRGLPGDYYSTFRFVRAAYLNARAWIMIHSYPCSTATSRITTTRESSSRLAG